MSGFKYTDQSQGGEAAFNFEGHIDEDVEFPSVDPSKTNKVRINLNGIKTINSVGIREWLDWIKPIAENAQVEITHAPKAMVFQFNMVEGFLPKKATVSSFYVPFFCEKNDKEENVLFNVGKEVKVDGGGVKIDFDPKTGIKCCPSDCEMEMDVTEAKYFQFLKKG